MSRNTHTPADVISARSRLVTDLLANHFPTLRNRTNDLDKRALAAALDLSHETVYRAVRGIEEMQLATARKLVKFSRENQDSTPLYLLTLMPFVIHDWPVTGVKPGGDESPAGDISGVLTPGIGDLLD